jgi:hypothetical protein
MVCVLKQCQRNSDTKKNANYVINTWRRQHRLRRFTNFRVNFSCADVGSPWYRYVQLFCSSNDGAFVSSVLWCLNFGNDSEVTPTSEVRKSDVHHLSLRISVSNIRAVGSCVFFIRSVQWMQPLGLSLDHAYPQTVVIHVYGWVSVRSSGPLNTRHLSCCGAPCLF